jgi:hypothetical protein
MHVGAKIELMLLNSLMKVLVHCLRQILEHDGLQTLHSRGLLTHRLHDKGAGEMFKLS